MVRHAAGLDLRGPDAAWADAAWADAAWANAAWANAAWANTANAQAVKRFSAHAIWLVRLVASVGHHYQRPWSRVAAGKLQQFGYGQ